MKRVRNKLTKGDKILSAILGLYIIMLIVFYYSTPNTAKEECDESNNESTYQVSEEEMQQQEEEIQDEIDELEKYDNKVVYIGNGWNDVYDKDEVYEVEDVIVNMSGENLCYKIKGMNEYGPVSKNQFDYYSEPLDTYGIYVYASFYNGDDIFGGNVHEDYDCFLLEKECLGSPLDVVRVDAGSLADSDEKYEHIGFCPFCSHYSDYYLNGDPR